VVGPTAGALPAEVRQTVCRVEVQWPPSGLPTVSNTCPRIGSFGVPARKSCRRTSQSLAQLLEAAGSTYVPPGKLSGSSLGNEPVKHTRAECAVPGSPTAESQTARTPYALENSRATGLGRADPRTRPRINCITGSRDEGATSGLRDRALPPRAENRRCCCSFSVRTSPFGVVGAQTRRLERACESM